MAQNPSPRHAVVTGGAHNIGLGIARRLREDGWRVFVLDIAEPEDPALRGDAQQVDLSDPEATTAALRNILKEGPVTCLVNNVGIVKPAPFDAVEIDDFDRIMHLNLRPSILAAKLLVPAMRAAGGGRIVMNTSRVTKGKIDRTLYSASKGAIQSMARTWALELARDGITVNCVAPGPIATTAFWENNPEDAPETRAIVDAVPMGRMGTPEDVAQAVAFFADARSGFITGQTVFVCGGTAVG
ncbi:MAG: SDR family NAD(P)-dependent oxidoreductase [Sulfitobacter sp.]|uniref:SDR family NAD(P)-dependent oxidoreductase n=1 Tax=unclassified Sulfitobacter TaxID=196795 RepID=UPI0007C367EE|nr:MULTISPECIES: SDR family oxidoreductase [unclassified Sulfitobacter]KZX95264.1 short-chain dehydrogenase [Sulfitobacter sp. HI0021]KZY02427.1 short-chain dehydrogenase [Sulfitobacter sp. HI0027]KZZ02200.1 short-chain dehydrogenase [Sulfitobacter sp. HI0076]